MNNRQRPDPLTQAKEFWSVVVLHKWIVLFATVVLIAISIVQISLLPDYYVASTTVLFDPQKLPEKYVTSTVTADPAQRLYTLTQEVLSASRLQQISEKLQLYPDSLRPSQQEIVDQMRKSITIEMKQGSERDMSAFVISYTGKKPEVVALVANRLADSFIEWDLAMREQQAAGATEFLTSQLQDAKQALEREEAKIGDFKIKHSGEMPEHLQANMQALSRLQVALQANGDSLNRLEQEKVLLTQAPEAARSVAAIPSQRSRLETEQRALQLELSDLRTQYTEEYPDVIATRERLAGVTSQLKSLASGTASGEVSPTAVRLQIVDRETERLQEDQKRLINQIDTYQARVEATPVRQQEIEDLSRDYTNVKEQYQGLLDNRFRAGMAMDLERKQKAERFILDPARVPEKPVKPNRLLLMTIALPFCFLIPAGTVIVAGEVQGTVNSERELPLLLPNAAMVIGRIPMIETPSFNRRRWRMAILSIAGSLTCCGAVALFLWKVHPHI
jgi:polysaccharide chain length determinant protein (PEP-CTERM system associated)